jgi:hypothetical protein
MIIPHRQQPPHSTTIPDIAASLRYRSPGITCLTIPLFPKFRESSKVTRALDGAPSCWARHLRKAWMAATKLPGFPWPQNIEHLSSEFASLTDTEIRDSNTPRSPQTKKGSRSCTSPSPCFPHSPHQQQSYYPPGWAARPPFRGPSAGT